MARGSIWTGLQGPPRAFMRTVKDDAARDRSRKALEAGRAARAPVSLRRFSWEAEPNSSDE
jgi:hypothetical protein